MQHYSTASYPNKLTSFLGLIFFLSGFAGLIYQVVWQRLLTVYYGVGTVSIILIVSVYMFGLGVGALWGGFLAERVRDKITLYFIVELLLGCFGVISLPLLDLLGRYTAGCSYFVSFLCMFAFLCLPTVLMGITLPLLTKIFNGLIQDFLQSISFLYFINTLGAAFGALCAGYVLISFWGLDISIYCAAAINLLLATLIFSIRHLARVQRENTGGPAASKNTDSLPITTCCLVVFISGFLAIGYEIVWFRVVGVLVKDSPYVFSSVLSVYLLGIAVGSFAISTYLRSNSSIEKRNLFFLLQFCISLYVIAVFIGYYYLTKFSSLAVFTQKSFARELHPDYMLLSFHSLKDGMLSLYALADVFFWPAVFVLVPTVLMGASFPLISFLALSDASKEGRTVGTVYFFNIAGNVFGGILTGLILLQYFGTERTLLLFSVIGLLFMLFVTRCFGKPLFLYLRTGIVTLVIIVSVCFFPGKGTLYEVMHSSPGGGFKSYIEEGVDGVIVTYQDREGVINYINGLYHGGRPGFIFSSEVLQAVLYARDLKNVLIIGYGTGTFVEAVLNYTDINDLKLIELNSTLIKNLKKMPLFNTMLSDKRVNLIFDDGRRFLLQSEEKFDLILMDPLRATTAYSNNLYSRQFFDILNQHLNPGGIVLIWLDEQRVLPKTVISAFPYVQMYSIFCLASNMPFKKNEERQKKIWHLSSPKRQAGLDWLVSLAGPTLGDQEYIKKKTKDYPINEDWKPTCEYYLGLHLRFRGLQNSISGKEQRF